MTIYKTTCGSVEWDGVAFCIESVDDPEPPTNLNDSGASWKLISSTMTEVRSSRSTIFWFWKWENL
jgi:hypothetical protein